MIFYENPSLIASSNEKNDAALRGAGGNAATGNWEKFLRETGEMHRRYDGINIPIEIVRTLVAIADLGSYSKAGEKLGLSQPAISARPPNGVTIAMGRQSVSAST